MNHFYVVLVGATMEFNTKYGRVRTFCIHICLYVSLCCTSDSAMGTIHSNLFSGMVCLFGLGCNFVVAIATLSPLQARARKI